MSTDVDVMCGHRYAAASLSNAVHSTHRAAEDWVPTNIGWPHMRKSMNQRIDERGQRRDGKNSIHRYHLVPTSYEQQQIEAKNCAFCECGAARRGRAAETDVDSQKS